MLSYLAPPAISACIILLASELKTYNGQSGGPPQRICTFASQRSLLRRIVGTPVGILVPPVDFEDKSEVPEGGDSCNVWARLVHTKSGRKRQADLIPRLILLICNPCFLIDYISALAR